MFIETKTRYGTPLLINLANIVFVSVHEEFVLIESAGVNNENIARDEWERIKPHFLAQRTVTPVDNQAAAENLLLAHRYLLDLRALLSDGHAADAASNVNQCLNDAIMALRIVS